MGKENDIVYVFDAFFDSRMKNVHTMLPGKIEKYYGHAERKARVKPLIKLRTVTGESLTIHPIDNVPVIFPGSSKFSLLYPLEKDDGCMIVFSEEGIGAFLKGKVEVTADSFAKFALTDAICIPGLWSFKNVPISPISEIIIDDDGNINLNGDGKTLVTHTELNTALQSMLTSINANFATKLNGAGAIGVNTLDISPAEASSLRTDG